jgi:putative redox protein
MSSSTTTLSAQIGRDHYKTEIKAGQHLIIGDEPTADGGTDLGLAPYQFLLSGLAACKVMTVRFYADREGWPLISATALLTMEVTRVGATTQTSITAQMSFVGDLSPDQRNKLLLIGDKCPVHKVLTGQITISSELA